MAKQDGIKIVAQNRRARHDYEVVQSFECGLELKGSEVKSLREGKAQLREAYARVDDNELWLFQMHVPRWSHAGMYSQLDPDRRRKLLAHAREIDEMREATHAKGLTLVPLAVYFKNGRAKVEVALARGRKTYDKRAALAKRDIERETQREIRSRN